MQPERRIVRKIQAYLEEQGARPFKIHGDDSYQEAGIPDLLVCYRGRFIGLEVKQPGGVASPLQKKVLHEIERSGGIAAIVDSVDQVRGLLAKLDRKRSG
jgi:VRR-NUC domain